MIPAWIPPRPAPDRAGRSGHHMAETHTRAQNLPPRNPARAYLVSVQGRGLGRLSDSRRPTGGGWLSVRTIRRAAPVWLPTRPQTRRGSRHTTQYPRVKLRRSEATRIPGRATRLDVPRAAVRESSSAAGSSRVAWLRSTAPSLIPAGAAAQLPGTTPRRLRRAELAPSPIPEAAILGAALPVPLARPVHPGTAVPPALLAPGLRPFGPIEHRQRRGQRATNQGPQHAPPGSFRTTRRHIPRHVVESSAIH